MGTKLTVRSDINIEDNYWFESSIYDSSVIDTIIDPAGGNIDKLLTAIPSPFARMHIFETAFDLALKNINADSKTVFDKIVSDCFDMLELLFHYKLHKERDGAMLSIKKWEYNGHVNNLVKSNNNGQKQLGEVLRKYYSSNETLRSMDQIYLFLFENKVFGGTSPFTVVFTRPDITNFNLKKSNGENYFSNLKYIWERDSDFIFAIYKLFSPSNNELKISACKVFNYLNSAVNFVNDDSLRFELQNLFNNMPTNRIYDYEGLSDESSSVIKICNAAIPTKRNITIQVRSPLEIDSKKIPNYCNSIPPLVLKDGLDHMNKTKQGVRIPTKQGEIKDISNRTLPDNNQKYPFLVVDDFLEENLLLLDYPINYTSFVVPKNLNNDNEKNPGFLLPVKKEYFDFFEISDLKENLEIIENNETEFTVKFKIPIKGDNPVIFTKKYCIKQKESEPVNMFKVDVNFAFFPLFKVKESKDYNDFYKIMLTDSEEHYKNVEVKIYDELNNAVSDNKNAMRFYKLVKRIEKTEKNFSGSNYYETNFPYKFLELNFSKERNRGDKLTGLIVPIWNEITLGSRIFDVAVDFGTTNTNIVLQEKGKDKNYEYFTIGENDLQAVLLVNKKSSNNLSTTEKYENYDSKIKLGLINRQIHEFIPSIIGEEPNPKYQFPIRTALATSLNYNKLNTQLLGNVNISFCYGKDIVRNDENTFTNLKWEISDGDNETKVTEFIKQLLLMVRNKILLNRGDPKEGKVIWFKPLSMYSAHQVFFKSIWDAQLHEILKLNSVSKQSFCLSESCAPYFYYKKQNKAQSILPVLSIDIGGGSTDVSFFLNDEPKFGISFNFAGNIIWSPRLNRDVNQLEGLYKKYANEWFSVLAQQLSNEKHSELNKALGIINSMTNRAVSQTELFNLYFAWDDVLHFTSELSKDPNIKFIILFHFSAIVYHCIYFMKLKREKKPEFICVSGRGSNYLNIVDPSKNLDLINGFIKNLINDIYKEYNTYDVKLEKVDLAKEATSIGGLYLISDLKENGTLKDTPNTDDDSPFLGENIPKWEKINYHKIKNELDNDNYSSESIFSNVNKNVHKFIDLFFSQNDKYNFNTKLAINIGIDFNNLKEYLKAESMKYLILGTRKRLENVKSDDSVNEPLFFYPITSMITDLAQKLYSSQNGK